MAFKVFVGVIIVPASFLSNWCSASWHVSFNKLSSHLLVLEGIVLENRRRNFLHLFLFAAAAAAPASSSFLRVVGTPIRVDWRVITRLLTYQHHMRAKPHANISKTAMQTASLMLKTRKIKGEKGGRDGHAC